MTYAWLAFKILHFKIFLYKLHRMMKMYSKYDNMHEKHKNYILKCANNHLIISQYYMLSSNQINGGTLPSWDASFYHSSCMSQSKY